MIGWESEEERDARRFMTEWDYAKVEDPQTYNDMMAPDGTRL